MSTEAGIYVRVKDRKLILQFEGYDEDDLGQPYTLTMPVVMAKLQGTFQDLVQHNRDVDEDALYELFLQKMSRIARKQRERA